MLKPAVLSILVLLPQETPPRYQPRDTADAARTAHALIWEYYWGYWRDWRGRPETPVSLGGPDMPRLWTLETPCEGDSWEGCFAGDWDCRADLDCLHPDQMERRRLLIEWLEHLAPSAGNSAFLFRQRVAFALKNGEPNRAQRIALECSGEDWWCLALRGLTAHWTQSGAGATAFDAALALAPRALGCFWREIDGVASPAVAAAVAPACEGGEEEIKRFWWLADPLWGRPGNERYVEHLARHVMKYMEEEIGGVDAANCGPTVHLARGFPNSIRHATIRARAGSQEAHVEAAWRARCGAEPDAMGSVLASNEAVYRTVVRYVYGGYSFAPDSLRFLGALESSPEDWAVSWNSGAERMLTRERWLNLDDQVALFRRGPELLAVAAAKLPPPLDTVRHFEPTLNLGRLDDLAVLTAPAHIDENCIFRASMTVPDGAYLASLEVQGEQIVGRARHGVPGPILTHGFGLSDLALVDHGSQQEGLDLVAALRPSLSLRRGERVGLYFEVYGLSDEKDLQFGLTAASVGRPPLLHRVLQTLGLRSEGQPVQVTWREDCRSGDPSALARFFSLDTGQLPSGETRLTLTVTTRDGRTARVSRRVMVRG